MRAWGFSAVILAAIGSASPASAQLNVVEIDSIDGTSGTTLYTTAPSNTLSVHLRSYHCLGGLPCKSDGGEGLLVYQGTSCTPDGGSVFQDHLNQCWYRANLNGDLRQWGVTAGSQYDAAVSATPTAIDTILGSAITAFSAAGIQTIHTGQVSVLLHQQHILNQGWSLTCDVPPVRDAVHGNFTNLPGSIVLGRGIYLDALSNNDVEIHNCAAIIPEWYINPSAVSWKGRVQRHITVSAAGGYASNYAFVFSQETTH
jgi:hypothetical protein